MKEQEETPAKRPARLALSAAIFEPLEALLLGSHVFRDHPEEFTVVIDTDDDPVDPFFLFSSPLRSDPSESWRSRDSLR
jgi:hypothetical protein